RAFGRGGRRPAHQRGLWRAISPRAIARRVLLRLVQDRFRDHGLYLMDEPEAALSPKRQLQFLALLHDYVKRGGQFVIATHSPIIMAYPDARIYLLNGEGIQEIAYTDTEHYLVTRGFLSNPQRTLSQLLDNQESG